MSKRTFHFKKNIVTHVKGGRTVWADRAALCGPRESRDITETATRVTCRACLRIMAARGVIPATTPMVGKPATFTVVVEPGARGGTGFQTVVYSGENAVEALKQIGEAHGYYRAGRADPEDNTAAPTGGWTEKALYDFIMSTNGDGCDYIIAIFPGALQEYKP